MTFAEHKPPGGVTERATVARIVAEYTDYNILIYYAKYNILYYYILDHTILILYYTMEYYSMVYHIIF